jgi:hypothetical protein
MVLYPAVPAFVLRANGESLINGEQFGANCRAPVLEPMRAVCDSPRYSLFVLRCVSARLPEQSRL